MAVSRASPDRTQDAHRGSALAVRQPDATSSERRRTARRQTVKRPELLECPRERLAASRRPAPRKSRSDRPHVHEASSAFRISVTLPSPRLRIAGAHRNLIARIIYPADNLTSARLLAQHSRLSTANTAMLSGVASLTPGCTSRRCARCAPAPTPPPKRLRAATYPIGGHIATRQPRRPRQPARTMRHTRAVAALRSPARATHHNTAAARPRMRGSRLCHAARLRGAPAEHTAT